jgi:hypothetical protein
MQVFKQFGGALGAGEQITDHQHGPLVTNQLQRPGYRTAIDLTSSQSGFLSPANGPAQYNTSTLFELSLSTFATWDFESVE